LSRALPTAAARERSRCLAAASAPRSHAPRRTTRSACWRRRAVMKPGESLEGLHLQSEGRSARALAICTMISMVKVDGATPASAAPFRLASVSPDRVDVAYGDDVPDQTKRKVEGVVRCNEQMRARTMGSRHRDLRMQVSLSRVIKPLALRPKATVVATPCVDRGRGIFSRPCLAWSSGLSYSTIECFKATTHGWRPCRPSPRRHSRG
jgi:hypothetical protein